MAEDPPPSPGPDALKRIVPEIHRLAAGTRLLRVWFQGSPHPSGFAQFRYFGPTSSRFDHHLPGPGGAPVSGPRGILYAVEKSPMALTTALAEVFQDSRLIDLHNEEPTVSIFALERDLPLLDLTAHWATKVGASAALSSGKRATARNWSRDFYAAYYSKVDGLRYRSSMSGGSDCALAIYELGATAMPARPLISLPLAHPRVAGSVVEAAERIGYDTKL